MYNNRFPYSQPRFFPPVIKWLVILNVGFYLLDSFILPSLIGGYTVRTSSGESATFGPLFLHGALWPLGSELFRPWQYITTMFLHGGPFHLIMNMFILWMFGMEVENMWGSKRFLIYYLLSGLGASVAHSLVTMSDAVQGPAVGASGAIFGVMLAFGLLFPDRIVFVGFFFPMRARFAVLLFIALDLWAGIADQPGDNVAHFAHLGGALTGFILLKTGLHSIIANKFFGGSSGRQAPRVQPPPRQPGPFSRADRRESARIVDARFRDIPVPPPRNAPVRMNFGEDQERIDQILDKISDEGYQSLTQEEKDLLNEVSKKMGS